MAMHSFERFCSLWLTRTKGQFVIENLPIRYRRKKRTKYSPAKGSTDIDLISFDPADKNTVWLNECKANIHSTFMTKSRDKLKKQLVEMPDHFKRILFSKEFKNVKRRVLAIKLAPRVKRVIPTDVEIIEGDEFEKQVLGSLIKCIADDPTIDPKDDVMGSLRLLWHFGCLKEEFYLTQTKAILAERPKLTPSKLRSALGLVKTKTPFCQSLLKKAKQS